jgi:hypothetical protein
MLIDSLNPRPCKVCLVPHDEEIHAATLSVRDWFRDQVTQGFYDYPEDEDVQDAALVECHVA